VIVERIYPIRRWIWRDAKRRARKLLSLGEAETERARDLLRASEMTSDPLLRRLYLEISVAEQRHGAMFRRRGIAILRALPDDSTSRLHTDVPSRERGPDDLRVDEQADETVLAFVYCSARAAARHFSFYRDVSRGDKPTRAIFEEVVREERFHAERTITQLSLVSPRRYRRALWYARLRRIWKAYLRMASAMGAAIGGFILTIQYFVVLPPFAWLAKCAERREARGWIPTLAQSARSPRRQY
jgi:hypothetical protein